MKKRLLFILCLIVGSGDAALAQTRTVTNADLEKFRQARVAAERDLRENYERLGFPSPEELEKQSEERQTEFEDVALQLRQERLQRQMIAAQMEALSAGQSETYIVREPDDFWQYRTGSVVFGGGYLGGYSGGYLGGYYGGFPGVKRRVRPRGFLNNRLIPRRSRLNTPLGGGYAFPSPFFNRPRGGIRVNVRPR